MPIAHAEVPSLAHAVFLQRAAQALPLPGGALQSRLGQGAFLALRLIDLLAPERKPVHPDAFRYQCAATARFLRDLRVTSTEGAHLQALVVSAGDAQREANVGLLLPGLFAYAHYLEDDLRLEEALDVLATLRQVGGGRLSAADSVALALRTGRVNRKLNRFDDAEQAYLEGGRVAVSAGDVHSELLSRIGRAHAMLGRGNLPEAEHCLTNALADARCAADARGSLGEHGLAAVLQHQGLPDAALGHIWRAFELYEEEDDRLRALNDAGIMFLMLGDPIAAERALLQVVSKGGSQDNVSNALIELMHCASYRRDRSRSRVGGSARREATAQTSTDYHLKCGIGEARFGLFRRSQASLTRAAKIAEGAGLHEFVFKIERMKNGLRACAEVSDATSCADAELVTQSEAMREVSASLAHFAARQI